MPSVDEMLNEELETMKSDSMINDEITIDPVTRMMNVPVTVKMDKKQIAGQINIQDLLKD